MLTSFGLLEKIAGNDVKQSAEEKKTTTFRDVSTVPISWKGKADR